MRRYALSLPILFIVVSAVLFVAGNFCVRSQGFTEQAKLASTHEAEPPLVPYLLPAVLLAVLRGPAVVFSTSDIGAIRSLCLLPAGVVWWWWVGAKLDSRGKSRHGSYLKGTLYALLSGIITITAVVLIPSTAIRYWHCPYFGFWNWRAAMMTANIIWLLALAILAAQQSKSSFAARTP
jgi:hypothetical protein